MKERSVLTIIDTSAFNTTGDLIKCIEASPDGYICLAKTEVIKALKEDELALKMQGADILHCGLCFHKGDPFFNLQLCTFDWNFLNPAPSVEVVSWKPSLHFMVFEKSLYRKMGGFDTAYTLPLSAVIDFSYRVMLQGGLTLHDPHFFSGNPGPPQSMDYGDEACFIVKHINRKAFNYYRFCLLMLKGKFIAPPRTPVAAEVYEDKEGYKFKLFTAPGRERITSYSAIIPTINRYDYIEKSIRSLLKLSFPPAEIIVVDQSPPSIRNKEIYRPFEESGVLKLIFLDRAGQSTARNAGLVAAANEWILLFEDDAEAWPEMVNEHIQLLSDSLADVSTGIVVGPGQDERIVPVGSRKFCLSDILTTGNAFLSRQTALSIGGFDPAFDHGPGADDDFGKRLYLAGKKIVYNYKSIETHYKAPKGGMREHGAWWRNKATFWGPFPPATQLYAIVKYYPPRFRFFLILSLILKARKRYSSIGYCALLLLLPFKIIRSNTAMKKLKWLKK